MTVFYKEAKSWLSRSAIQYFFWRHPEWWTDVLACLAWILLLHHGWQNVGHGVHHGAPFTQELGYFLLMVAAMMLPLITHRVWVTATSSLFARRHRAIAGFLAGYFIPWLALGLVAAAVREGSWTHSYAAAALLFLAATAWRFTSIHERGLAGCYSTQPLALTGWRAHRDCVRFGATIGSASLLSCWPLMLACTVAGHSLFAMVGGMVVSASERWPLWGRTRVAVSTTLVLSTYYLALTFTG